MTEPAKPRFPRRIVIAAALFLVVILVAVWMADRPSVPKGVAIHVVGFERSPDGKTFFAKVVLTNGSTRTMRLMTDDNCESVWARVVIGTAPKGELDWMPPGNTRNKITTMPIRPGQYVKTRVQLLPDGAAGPIVIGCIHDPGKEPVLLARLRSRWPRLFPRPSGKLLWIPCQEQIERPLLREDGTVQPGRILSAEAKR